MKRYEPITGYVNRHVGRAAVICGGGESLPAHLAQAPADAVYFAANDHLLKLRAADYLCAVDSIEARLRVHGVPIIAPQRWADVRLFEEKVPSSGATAAYAAWIMGCAPIILAGMDCYIGGTYFHDAKARTTGKGICLNDHLARWRSLLEICWAGDFCTFGGPTEQVFAKYPQTTRARGPTGAEPKRLLVCGVQVEFLKDHDFGRLPFKKGERFEISANETRAAIFARAARKLSPAEITA